MFGLRLMWEQLTAAMEQSVLARVIFSFLVVFPIASVVFMAITRSWQPVRLLLLWAFTVFSVWSIQQWQLLSLLPEDSNKSIELLIVGIGAGCWISLLRRITAYARNGAVDRKRV